MARKIDSKIRGRFTYRKKAGGSGSPPFRRGEQPLFSLRRILEMAASFLKRRSAFRIFRPALDECRSAVEIRRPKNAKTMAANSISIPMANNGGRISDFPAGKYRKRTRIDNVWTALPNISPESGFSGLPSGSAAMLSECRPAIWIFRLPQIWRTGN